MWTEDGRTDDGRTPDHGYTISAPMSLRLRFAKIVYTPVNPSFTIYKWNVRRSSLHALVFVMSISWKVHHYLTIGARNEHSDKYDLPHPILHFFPTYPPHSNLGHGYKSFLMLNSAEHIIYPAHEC